MNEGRAIKDEILQAGDVCYTCWEIEDFCECDEGFDSTRAREEDDDFDDGGPRSVEEIVNLKAAEFV